MASSESPWSAVDARAQRCCACLDEEIEVGNPLDHGPQEDWEEGDNVILGSPDGVAHIALVYCTRAQPDSSRVLPIIWRPRIQGCPWVAWLQKRRNVI